jgi:gliding motility-associated-like protein
MCLAIPQEEFLAKYSITDNGTALDSVQIATCMDESFTYYRLDVLTTANSGPYTLENWTVNGVNKTGTFANPAELTALLNQSTPGVTWTYDATNKEVKAQTPPSIYSNMQVRETSTNSIIILEKYADGQAAGTRILLGNGAHHIVVTELATGKTDSALIVLYCLHPDTVEVTLPVDSILFITLPILNELPGTGQTVQILLQDINGNFAVVTPVVGSNNTISITGVTVGTEYVVAIVCDNLGVCDTTFIIIHVTETGDRQLIIYNGFSPNNDGLNDTWVIKNIDLYPGNELRVFNRWGNEVMESKDYKNDWKGTWNGANLPDGVYFYVIDLKDGSKVRSGFIQIQR